MNARAQARFERACEDHAHLLARFADYETLKKERDALQAEVKYLREHMENAGGGAWADAEGHEIRSYLRAILRGPNKEKP